jgi:uncharacterized membrane protein YbhN (UPF0104 family)
MKKNSPLTLYNTIILFIPLVVFSILINMLIVYLLSIVLLIFIAYMDVRRIIFHKNKITIKFILSGKKIELLPEEIEKIEFRLISSRRDPPSIVIHPIKLGNTSFFVKIFKLRIYSFFLSTSMKPFYLYIKEKTLYFNKIELNIDKKKIKDDLKK